MLIRRLLLVLLFLLAQAGGLAHGIGHGTAPTDEGLDHKAACALCLAFAPLGAGLAGMPSVWVPPAAMFLLARAVPAASPSVFQTTCRNRGPPRLSW
jgi:hypothetical protein